MMSTNYNHSRCSTCTCLLPGDYYLHLRDYLWLVQCVCFKEVFHNGNADNSYQVPIPRICIQPTFICAIFCLNYFEIPKTKSWLVQHQVNWHIVCHMLVLGLPGLYNPYIRSLHHRVFISFCSHICLKNRHLCMSTLIFALYQTYTCM